MITVMTSNRPLEEWGKLLGEVPTAGAILDRFLHHAQAENFISQRGLAEAERSCMTLHFWDRARVTSLWSAGPNRFFPIIVPWRFNR